MRMLPFALACAADAALGDPATWPHPVRMVGAVCSRGERMAFCYARGDAKRELVAGALLCVTLVGGTYAAARAALVTAFRIDRRLGLVLEAALGWTTLAARDLIAEASAVTARLECGDVCGARRQVARIVGRDTAQLDAAEITRATIETLAESACDGIIAPLLALAIGGVPLALAFKTASTLDSMIGHIEPPYTFLGRVSARLDDVACYLPARITALVIAACSPLIGADAWQALIVLRDDGHRHRSPNAGRPEAAMAGALGVRLGGRNHYDGVAREGAFLGADLPAPTIGAARQAATLVGIVAVTFAATIGVVLGVLDSFGIRKS
jgi:adenosylcobinamide-phosphate synthase